MDATVDRALQRWVAADLLEQEHADELRRHEAARGEDADAAASVATGRGSPPVAAPTSGAVGGQDASSGRGRLLAEGLAYVGAAFTLGAGAVLLGEVWDDLGDGARFGLALGVAVLLAAGARALWDQQAGPGRRLATLAAVLAGVAATAAAGLGLDAWATLSDGWLVAGVGAVAIATVGPVQRLRPAWPSVLVLGAAVLAVTFGVLDEVLLDVTEVVAGIVLAGLGLAWAAAGWGGLAAPRNAFVVTGLLAGGTGAQLLAFDGTAWFGLALGIAVSAAVLALAVATSDTPGAVLGGLGLTVFAPQVVTELFGDAAGGPVALLVTGVTLVLAAVLALRTRDGEVTA